MGFLGGTRTRDARLRNVRLEFTTALGDPFLIPLTRRGRGYHMALPDRIVIFQQPLQRLARSKADLSERVGHVVRHEIAHYFGISDDRLREIDAY